MKAGCPWSSSVPVINISPISFLRNTTTRRTRLQPDSVNVSSKPSQPCPASSQGLERNSFFTLFPLPAQSQRGGNHSQPQLGQIRLIAGLGRAQYRLAAVGDVAAQKRGALRFGSSVKPRPDPRHAVQWRALITRHHLNCQCQPGVGHQRAGVDSKGCVVFARCRSSQETPEDSSIPASARRAASSETGFSTPSSSG